VPTALAALDNLFGTSAKLASLRSAEHCSARNASKLRGAMLRAAFESGVLQRSLFMNQNGKGAQAARLRVQKLNDTRTSRPRSNIFCRA